MNYLFIILLKKNITIHNINFIDLYKDYINNFNTK